jgi:hypothetical protein
MSYEWAGEREVTLADVQREFAGWTCWEHAGRFYASAPGEPWLTPADADADGDDPMELRDAIIRELWLEEARAG